MSGVLTGLCLYINFKVLKKLETPFSKIFFWKRIFESTARFKAWRSSVCYEAWVMKQLAQTRLFLTKKMQCCPTLHGSGKPYKFHPTFVTKNFSLGFAILKFHPYFSYVHNWRKNNFHNTVVPFEQLRNYTIGVIQVTLLECKIQINFIKMDI